jgi:predicted LPLAT superfamily acyltransferase
MTMLADWAEQTERGSSVLISAMLWLVLGLGARASRWLVLPATLWFIATSGRARAASRDYLGRVFGRPARLRDVVRHFHCFGSAILDRVFLLTGRTGGFRITTEGLDVVADIVARHRGCVLLGAHLGSFEVLRSVTSQAPAPVWALMFRGNAGVLTQALERLNPSLRQSVIEIGEITGMLRVSECIARGEIVGILADRTPAVDEVGYRADNRRIAVPFLGSKALFPAGPFVLAALLGAPVVLFHGVRTGAQRYTVHFEPFADRVVLRRGARSEDLRAVIGRYAAALERACRAHPFNWFNFFAFWEDGDNAELAPEGADPDGEDTDGATPDRAARDGAAPHSGNGALAGADAGLARCHGAAARANRSGGGAVSHGRG